MRLGYHTGYWSAGPPPGAQEAVLGAEQLGFDSVWTAEAYGSDALTPLAWWGARTSRIRLGTAIAQISARTPTAAAMAALTLDHLSGGRFVLGLGASGPQVVEGWYGQPYPKPLARTREYVAIVRQVLAREAPVTFDGQFYRLPLPADEGSGLGKALRSTVHPLRSDLPIHLAAEGPRNIAMSAEIADGWLPLFYSPRMDGEYRTLLAEGFAKRAAGLSPVEDFEVVATVPVVLGADVESAADSVRPFIALYAGGMGAKGANFHRDVLDRLGYAEACDEIQAHYLAGDRARATAAVPLELVQDIALVGTVEDIRAQLPAWEGTAVTTMLVQADPRTLPRSRTLCAHRPDRGMDDDYAEAVLDLVAAIPAGRAMTYGTVAEVVGDLLEARDGVRRGGPRQVGQVMSRAGSGVPWWRVVNAAGKPPARHTTRALALLGDEGTPLSADGMRVALRRAIWFPDED